MIEEKERNLLMKKKLPKVSNELFSHFPQIFD